MTSHRIRCIGLAVLLVSSAAPLVAQAGHSLLRIPEQTEAEKKIRLTSIRRTMDRVAPAIVHVKVKVNGLFRLQRDSSGVVISPGGLVLTNWHLVREVEIKKSGAVGFAVKVKTASGTEYPAKVVAKDEGTDLVLLKIDLSQGAKLPYAKLGNQPVPGETVIVGSRPGEGIYANFIGSLSPSLTAVTVHGKTIAKADIALADANVNVFADGSPVFDINGRVLAIVNTSNVKLPLHEKSSDEERKAYRTSFGFATRVAAAKRVFAKHLEGIEANPETSAVVSVRRASLKKVPKSDASDPHGKFPNDDLGSGVIVHESGLVLTNAHIAGKKGAKVWVTTVGGKTYEGVVLDASSAKNTAVIKLVLPPNTKLPFLTLADSSSGQLGERVAALGNRYGHTVTAKVGVLSSKQRSQDVGDQHKRSMGHFQTDATIHNGNTGGALINADGELLGVNDVRAAIDEMDKKEQAQAKMALTDTTIGFALPANVIREELREALTGAVGKTGHLVEVPKSTAAALERRASQITAVVQKHANSFLNVFVKKVTLGAPKGGLMADLFPEPADDKHFHLLGQGSGVIIDPTGLALTNWHVVDAATYKDGAAKKDHKVFVSLHTGKKYEVEILSTSRIDDLALYRHPERCHLLSGHSRRICELELPSVLVQRRRLVREAHQRAQVVALPVLQHAPTRRVHHHRHQRQRQVFAIARCEAAVRHPHLAQVLLCSTALDAVELPALLRLCSRLRLVVRRQEPTPLVTVLAVVEHLAHRGRQLLHVPLHRLGQRLHGTQLFLDGFQQLRTCQWQRLGLVCPTAAHRTTPWMGEPVRSQMLTERALTHLESRAPQGPAQSGGAHRRLKRQHPTHHVQHRRGHHRRTQLGQPSVDQRLFPPTLVPQQPTRRR